MTSIDRSDRVLRLAILPVLLLVALFAWLPGDAGASPGHDGAGHASHLMHHGPVAADGHQIPADCAGSAFFCAMMGLCHPALSPTLLVMPVISNVNDPAAPPVADSSGRHPPTSTPPPRRLFV